MFSARVLGDPAAAIHEVWVVYTDGGGTWVPLDLQQCTGAAAGVVRRARRLARLDRTPVRMRPASVQYVVQAANGTGLVSFDDNRGQYYLGSTTPAPVAVATTLDLITPPRVRDVRPDRERHRPAEGRGIGVVGKPVIIQIGGAAAIGLTGSNGRVTLPLVAEQHAGRDEHHGIVRRRREPPDLVGRAGVHDRQGADGPDGDPALRHDQ